jgi:hypothetical protein
LFEATLTTALLYDEATGGATVVTVATPVQSIYSYFVVWMIFARTVYFPKSLSPCQQTFKIIFYSSRFFQAFFS